MRRTNAKIIGGVLVLAIILVGIAYAAITNTELNISGTGKAEGSQSNFVVEFIGTPTTSGDGTTVATIDEKVKTKGTITVTKLTTRGETATERALNGEDPTEQLLWEEAVRLGLDPEVYAAGGAKYFYNPNACSEAALAERANIKCKVQIGNHVFYKVWDK